MHRITVMSKPGCTLCDKAVEVIHHMVRVPVMVEIVDITKDQDLLEKYKNDIPVILVDGVERFRHRIDPDKLAAIFGDEAGGKIPGVMG